MVLLAPLDIEAPSHQVSERQALGVRQPASIRAGPPEVNPNTRRAIFLLSLVQKLV